MPHQFYMTADPPPFTPVLWRGAWDDTSLAVSIRLDSTKTTADPLMYTIQSNAVAESSTSFLYRAAVLRLVGGPLIAQQISGTMQMRIGAFQDAPEAELYFAIHAWVSIGTTSELRGTIINNFAERADSMNPWPTVPKGRDLILSAAIDALQVRDDDRLVIEVGYIARNTSTTPYTGALYYGTDYYSNGCPDQVRDPD